MTGSCLPIDMDTTTNLPKFSAAIHRAAQAALMTGRTDRALGARSGLHPGSDPTVTFSGRNYTVTPFCGIADPNTGGSVGPYLVAFTLNETGTVNAADAANTRIDRLDVVVPDDPPGSTRVAILQYTAGVASANPAAPAAPAQSFPLGTITVPSTSSGGVLSFAPSRRYAVASGGITPIVDSTVYPTAPYDGQAVYRQDDDTLRIWDGSSWEVHGGGDTGVLTSGVSALAGFSLSTARLMGNGGLAAVYVSGTLTTAISVGTSGDTPNTDIAKITNAALLPRAGTWTQPLSSGASGPVLGAVLSVDGTITITATAAATLAAGQVISVGGTFIR